MLITSHDKPIWPAQRIMAAGRRPQTADKDQKARSASQKPDNKLSSQH
jgi:hypothetical protein